MDSVLTIPLDLEPLYVGFKWTYAFAASQYEEDQ